ncbi:hypothetical protein GH714_004005 [Hevea brasiliensis]|uniref:Uncharacterized protein n=1 Tax=Hevea brasiliensis TaxID=3981 RepID=A0A6A6KGL5_HEVBR|nr:hypothetical protein GH714_004005 [Hevea brasiliensis]
MCPYQPVVSRDQFTCGMVISSPFAANIIQVQSPLPNESTRKSSTKKQTTIQKIICIYADINKENIDNNGRKIEPNKDKVKKVVNEEKYEDFSLRKLTKMLKELQIAKEARNVSKHVGTRPALQALTENCRAAGMSRVGHRKSKSSAHGDPVLSCILPDSYRLGLRLPSSVKNPQSHKVQPFSIRTFSSGGLSDGQGTSPSHDNKPTGTRWK